MKRMQDVPWLTVGPDPHFATCQRCGRTVPQPPLPMKVDAFVAYTAAFAKEHAGCLDDAELEGEAVSYGR